MLAVIMASGSQKPCHEKLRNEYQVAQHARNKELETIMRRNLSWGGCINTFLQGMFQGESLMLSICAPKGKAIKCPSKAI